LDRGWLASARARMQERRAQRVRPHLDDKILTSWNGLMLGALARAAVILEEPGWLAAAERNVAFLRSRLWVPAAAGEPGRMHHRWREGERDQALLLDDHAYLLEGVLHLYEATLETRHLEFAVDLAAAMVARFHDPGAGGFWQSAASDLILQVKEDYDGAEPSGNSVAALSLLRLAAITDQPAWREAAEGVLRLFAERLMKSPQGLPSLLQAVSFSLQDPHRVVIAGDVGSSAGRALLRAAHRVYQPNRVILGTRGPVEAFARTLTAKAGRPTVYLCTGSACQPPTHEAEEVVRGLNAPR
jgi:uncharacterized protein YyaL (SSP411 family)